MKSNELTAHDGDYTIYEFLFEEDDLDQTRFNWFGEVTEYNKNGLYIAVYDERGRNFADKPYYKVSWSSNFPDSKVARIDMKTQEYIVHNKISAELGRKEVKMINKALSSKCETKTNQNICQRIWKEFDTAGMSDKEIDKKKNEIMNTKYTVWDALVYDVYIQTLMDKSFTEFRETFPYHDLKKPEKKNGYTWIHWEED